MVHPKKITLCLLLYLITLCPTVLAQEKAGWVKFVFNQAEVILVADNDYQNILNISSGDSLLMRAGSHRLLLIGKNFNDYKSTVTVLADSTVTKRMNFYLRESPFSSFEIFESGRNVAISTDDDGEIFVDGNHVGTSYSEILLTPGIHHLNIKHEQYGDLTTPFDVMERQVTEVARYNADPTPTPTHVKLLPGGSYLANQQRGKAMITYVGLIAFTASSIHENNRYNSLDKQYQAQYLDYLTASSPDEALRFREKATNTLDDMKATNTKLTLSVIGIAAVYLASTLDGLRKPKAGYSGPSYFVPSLSYQTHPITGSAYPSLTFKKQLK